MSCRSLSEPKPSRVSIMEVTEVRFKMAEYDPFNERILGYCTVILENSLAITDIKLIRGRDAGMFIGMPARKVTDKCESCRRRNHLKAAFCNNCGASLDPFRGEGSEFYQDITFPICNDFRKMIEAAVFKVYEDQVQAIKEHSSAS